jgi:hypothetical protein
MAEGEARRDQWPAGAGGTGRRDAECIRGGVVEGGGWRVEGYQSLQNQSMAYSRANQAKAEKMARTKTFMVRGIGFSAALVCFSNVRQD